MDNKAEELFEMETKDLRSANLFKIMTPIAKYHLFLANPERNTNKISLFTDKNTNFELNYTIYSKKAFKNYFKFATQDNFDNSKNISNSLEIPDEIYRNCQNSFDNSLKELRKKELFIKFLKPLQSKFTRILVKFEEKSFEECWKTVAKVDFHEKNPENGVFKQIFLVETQENSEDFSIDYNLMANDKKINEWEGFLWGFSIKNTVL